MQTAAQVVNTERAARRTSPTKTPQPARPTSSIRAQRRRREHGIRGRSPRRRRQLRPRRQTTAPLTAEERRVGAPPLASAATVWEARYEEFGKRSWYNHGKPEDFIPFGFAGGLYDVDTGLVRFGARNAGIGYALAQPAYDGSTYLSILSIAALSYCSSPLPCRSCFE